MLSLYYLVWLVTLCQCRSQKKNTLMQERMDSIEQRFEAEKVYFKLEIRKLQLELDTEKSKTDLLEARLNATVEELDAMISIQHLSNDDQPDLGVPTTFADLKQLHQMFIDFRSSVEVSLSIMKRTLGEEKTTIRQMQHHVRVIQQIEHNLKTLDDHVTLNTEKLEILDDQLVELTNRPRVPGQKGERGERGEPGIAGQQGENGNHGKKGVNGNQGAKGQQGEKGEQGMQGPRGSKGDKGDPGSQVCFPPDTNTSLPDRNKSCFAPGEHIVGMTCEAGQILDGDKTLTCLKDGTWNGTALCVNTCLAPDTNASLPDRNKSLYLPQEQISGMTCDDGQKLEGETTLTCFEDGTWNGTAACINITCLAPDTNVSLPDRNKILYLPQEQISGMTCDDGQRLDGDKILTCLEDGTWKGTVSCVNIKEARYRVRVETGNHPFAGTDADIFVRLNGDRGVSEEVQLTDDMDKTWNTFESGMANEFELYLTDVGTIHEINIRLEDVRFGFKEFWRLQTIAVYDFSRKKYYPFIIHRWIFNSKLITGNTQSCGDEFTEQLRRYVPDKIPATTARDAISCNLKSVVNLRCYAAVFRAHSKECFWLDNSQFLKMSAFKDESPFIENVYVRKSCETV